MQSENDSPSDDIRAIESLLSQFDLAISSGDAANLADFFCVDAAAFFTGKGDLLIGRDAVVETWRRHLCNWSDVVIRRHATFVRIHGDVAWASFLWDGEGTAESQRYQIKNERWTVVMLWEDGDWRFAQTHTSLPYFQWENHKK